MAPPANDDYANAETLTGEAGHVDGTTTDATSDDTNTGSLDGLNNVWYVWTAPIDGTVSFDTFSDPTTAESIIADTQLSAYEDDFPFPNPSWITTQDDVGANPRSRVIFDVEEGTTYRIEVMGYDDGAFRLTWRYTVTRVIRGLCIAPNDAWDVVNPEWTRLDDTTADWSLRVFSVSIDRGTDAETDTTKTGTLSASCHDPYGTLDPTNQTGPFWDTGNSETLLNPNIQLAYARYNPDDGTWSTRFRGFVRAFRHTLDTSGFAEVTIEAVDAFEMFADLRLTPGDQGDTPPDDSVGDIYYAGGSPVPAEDTFKHVDQRIVQALDDVGWPGTGLFRDPTVLRDIFSGNVTVQAEVYERDGQAVEVMTDAADAEFPDVSRLFVSREGVVSFRGRFARFFPENPGYGIGQWELGGAAQAEADADVVLISDLTFRRSKQDIINVALALPKGLEDGDVPGQQVEDATSIDKYGRRPWITDSLLTWEGHDELGDPVTAADETKKFATFKVENFKDPKTRVERITVKWRHPDSFSGPAAWAFLNGVELGDLVHVETTHPGGGGFDEDFFVEAIRETDSPGPDANTYVVVMDIDVSPRSFYSENPFGELDVGNS